MLFKIAPALMGAAVVLATTAAWAEPLRMGLVYKRAPGMEGCPDRAGFRLRAIGVFGRDPFDDDESDRRLSVQLRQQDGEVIVDAILVEAGRVLWTTHNAAPVADCRDALDAVALGAKTALIRVIESPPRKEPAGPGAPAADDGAGAAVPKPPSPGVTTRARAFRVGVGARGVAYWWDGLVPAFGPGLWSELRWPHISIAAEAAYLPPSGDTYRVRALLGGASVCAHGGPLFACGVWTFGRAFVSAPSGSDSGSLSAIGPRLGVDLPLTETLKLRVSADLARRLNPYIGTINELPVMAPPPWFVGVGLGIAAYF